MSKEVGYIKFGSYGGYKIYEDEHFIKIWQIGSETIVLPKEIAKEVVRQILELLNES